MTSHPDRNIATIVKNAREELRVEIRTMHGQRMVDARVYAKTKRGDTIPTPKGIAIRPDLVREVANALQTAAAEVEKEPPS